MMRAGTKRVRASKAIRTAMRVMGNGEAKGSKGIGVGDEGGVQQKGQWRWRQMQLQQGWQESGSDKGDCDGDGDKDGDGNGNEAGG